jgi:uncharacterized membrane protein YczE
MSDKKIKVTDVIKQAVCYLLGLILIACGITLTKMSKLGISPVSSIPRACEVIWGFTLGTTTLIIYVILILLQLAVFLIWSLARKGEFRERWKKYSWLNLLGFPLTFAFSFIVDLMGVDPNAVGHLLIWIPAPGNYAMKLLYTVCGIIIIGIGVFLYLRPRWIPMPAEGLAGAISTVTGKAFGDCKTFVDVSMITIALILQLIFLGGFKSFARDDVVVREGTILAAVCVGQIVKLCTKLFGRPLEKFLGIPEKKK